MSEPIKLTTFRYRPDIDGLRALAVVAVVLFHFGFGVTGGYVGVDIFFVISGYLITSIIAKDIEKGDFNMLRFWERRIRRIVPVLVVVVAVVSVAGVLFIYPDGFKSFCKEIIAQSALVSNFYFWQQDGYFAAPSETRPLLHTWSLAVEEQFYFVFPIFLVWLYRTKPRMVMKWVVWSLVVSFVWSLYGVYAYPRASFFLLPARAWELLLGSVVALYKFKRRFGSKSNELLSWIAVGLMVLPMFIYDKSWAFPGLAAFPPCVGAALIIFCNQQSMGLASRLLALPPVVFIGKISYSLYLWHWPIIVYFNYTMHPDELSLRLSVSLILLSFSLAVLTWRYVETPFRKGFILSDRKSLFRAFYLVTGLFIVGGSAAYRSSKHDGWAWRFRDEVNQISKLKQMPFTWRVPFIDETDAVEAGKFGRVVRNHAGLQSVPVLLWGDSHAYALVPLFQKLCVDNKINIVGAVGIGLSPLMGEGEDVDDKSVKLGNEVFDLIKKKNIREVVIVGRWSGMVYGAQLAGSVKYDAKKIARQKERFSRLFIYTVKRLRDAGVRVTVMKQVPFQKVDVPRAMLNVIRFGRDRNESITKMSVTLAEHKKHQSFVDGVIDSCRGPGVEIYDPTSYLLKNSKLCRLELDGMPLYKDRDHLSELGAMQLEPLFMRMFERFSEEYVEPVREHENR